MHFVLVRVSKETEPIGYMYVCVYIYTYKIYYEELAYTVIKAEESYE